MRVDLVPPHQLTTEQLAVWQGLLPTTPPWDSPFFQPAFVQTVAEVRPDVRVAVIETQGQLLGFFPFQRSRWGIGRPVAAGLSEFHGVIASPESEWSASELLRACGLWSWQFDHLPQSQWSKSSEIVLSGESPALDLSRGFAAFADDCRARGSRVLAQLERKRRKLERERGPVRWEAHGGEGVLEILLRWKSEQHRRTGVLDILRFPWVPRLLRAVSQCRTADLRGLLSVLYVADVPAAAHLGLASRHVLHWWYPAFDRSLAPYSPGQLLLLESARWAADEGLRRIDLGPGDQRYKQRWASQGIPVALGSFDRSAAARGVRSRWRRLRTALATARLPHVVRQSARQLNRLRDRLAWH